jgi:hypothetical protein
MRRKLFFSVAAVVLLGAGAALALNLGEAVVKTVAVGAVVNAVAKPADQGINTLLGSRKLPLGTATKVVPVLSLGEKGYVGAAQVAGSQKLVNRTKSVVQLETSFDNKQYRIKLLMPMDSVNPVGMNRVRGIGVSALVDTALSHSAYSLPPSERFNVGDLLKAGAIAVATNQFGGQINSFINGVFKNQGGTPEGATKVVPYLSFGTKAYIGMMQVAGPAAAVGKVKAVWQFEQLFDSGRVRLRALAPCDSINPLQLRRVKGVGCTAVIDAMALRAKDRERYPDHYRYFDRAPIFVGLGEDPRWHPPGWDRGRKEGWIKHGNPNLPPGLAKKQGPVLVVPGKPGRGRVIVPVPQWHEKEHAPTVRLLAPKPGEGEQQRLQVREREQRGKAERGKGKGKGKGENK